MAQEMLILGLDLNLKIGILFFYVFFMGCTKMTVRRFVNELQVFKVLKDHVVQVIIYYVLF